MLRLAGERESLNVVGDQIGAPTSARTLSDITSMILASSVTKQGFGALAERSGVYHAVNSGATSWYEFAREIFRLATAHGVPLKLKDLKSIATEAYPTPAQRPKNSRLSLEKLATTFQITPASWDAALAWAMPFIVWGQALVPTSLNP
jgi:dTDP-4-dehydrorhamnose reductase